VIDLYQLGYWLLALTLFVAVPLLTTRQPVARHFVGERLNRLGAWAADRVTPVPEVDQLADDLSRILRVEKLRCDVRRLQRIIATDMAMSATRQLGNRIAYNWLLTELERTRNLSQATAGDGSANSWRVQAATRDLRPTEAKWSSGYDPQHRTNVEVLDIRWK
jgi:hypothetical protein